MTVWYVHKRDDGGIASVHGDPQPGYAEEPMDDAASPLKEWFENVRDPVPAVVTPWRLRVALRAAGKLAAVEAWVAQQSADIQDAWEYGLERPIDHPLIRACATACNLDLPPLFRAAGKVR